MAYEVDMQQRWWLLAAGAVGIALAVLLFPKPDSSDIPDQDKSRTHVLDFKGSKKFEEANKPLRMAERKARPVTELGLNPIHARMLGDRNTPEGVFAGRLSGPWTLVRRELIAADDPAAKTLADEIATVVLDLRALRRDPKSADWGELERKQRALIDQLRANEAWMALPTVSDQIARMETLFDDYENAAAAAARGELPSTPNLPQSPPPPIAKPAAAGDAEAPASPADAPTQEQ